jgi:peroxiredoxin
MATKNMITTMLMLGISLTAFAQSQALRLGSKAPDTNHEVEETSGRKLTLQGAADNNGLLVIFTCNTCPWVAKWEDRMNELYDLTRANNVGMITLNPNERIRNRGESIEDMKRRAQKQGYKFSYALDKDHKLADAFGATRTPEVFLFDHNLKLVYHGAIDDNANKPNAVKNRYTANAINALGSGGEIDKGSTKTVGCTIKRNR